jgi:hypothetical protein
MAMVGITEVMLGKTLKNSVQSSVILYNAIYFSLLSLKRMLRLMR